jgi:hypothetical protein
MLADHKDTMDKKIGDLQRISRRANDASRQQDASRKPTKRRTAFR